MLTRIELSAETTVLSSEIQGSPVQRDIIMLCLILVTWPGIYIELTTVPRVHIGWISAMSLRFPGINVGVQWTELQGQGGPSQ